MAAEHVILVWTHAAVRSLELITLLAMAEAADAQGQGVVRSEDLAILARTTAYTVRDSGYSLHKKGFIALRINLGREARMIYQLNLSKIRRSDRTRCVAQYRRCTTPNGRVVCPKRQEQYSKRGQESST